MKLTNSYSFNYLLPLVFLGCTRKNSGLGNFVSNYSGITFC